MPTFSQPSVGCPGCTCSTIGLNVSGAILYRHPSSDHDLIIISGVCCVRVTCCNTWPVGMVDVHVV